MKPDLERLGRELAMIEDMIRKRQGHEQTELLIERVVGKAPRVEGRWMHPCDLVEKLESGELVICPAEGPPKDRPEVLQRDEAGDEVRRLKAELDGVIEERDRLSAMCRDDEIDRARERHELLLMHDQKAKELCEALAKIGELQAERNDLQLNLELLEATKDEEEDMRRRAYDDLDDARAQISSLRKAIEGIAEKAMDAVRPF